MSQLPSSLRRFTPARVGLGRVGTAQPSAAQLAFNAAHAAARDAVWSVLDVPALEAALPPPVLRVRSQARDRREYLLRPDLGRKLHPDDAAMLADHKAPGSLVFLVADGLCATGVQAHAPALIRAVAPLLPLPLGPVVVAAQGRVALGDAVAEALEAAAVAVLIGERPGLSAQDSLGCYLTWAPRIGRTDAERNCISNIRPEGMPPAEAAPKLAWLVRAAVEQGETGVALKDESPNLPLLGP